MNEITVAAVLGRNVVHLKRMISLTQRDELLTYIAGLVKRFKYTLAQYESIIVVRGPGPFTTIRVGVALANALGLALNIPVYGIKRSENSDIASLVAGATRLPVSKTSIRPFYDRPPNITKPKSNNTSRSGIISNKYQNA